MGRVQPLCVDRLEDGEHFVPMPLQTAFPANSALIPPDALPAGTRLEDYEIDCVIARSAVAMVYRALDRRCDQLVAIKEFLPIGLAMRGADGGVVTRESVHEQSFQRGRQIFLEQARSLEKHEHTSLMRVLRVMECHGTVYKVMPFCLGPTLLEFRQAMSAAPTEQVLRSWLEGLMGALAQFHDRGQLHGAVSPGNILMLRDAGPVLLDSDAVHAAILSDRTRCMIASLGPCFAPQEQCDPADDRPLGPWADLYSLAATLRFCVSGQLPGAFQQSPRGMLAESGEQRHGGAIAPAGAATPPWLAALDACLAEAGRDRPQSLTQLTKLLRVDSSRAPTTPPAAKAGPARLLSTPLARPPASAAPGVERKSTESSPPPRDAEQLPLQMPLPLVSPSPATTAAKGRDAVDHIPPQARTGRSRFRNAGMAAVLVLAAIAATSISLLRPQPPLGDDTAAAAKVAQPAATAVQRTVAAPVAPTAPRVSVPQVALPSTGKADTPAHALAVRPTAPSPPPGKPAPKAENARPVGPNATNKPVKADSPVRASSPRQACSGRERYALLQCMNEQCAKSTWTKHEQCVRLRREKKL